MPRAVFPGVAHHLTQRGVDRQPVFFADRDRHVYLQLVQRAATHFGVSLVGYCLMPNHVHWIAVPESPASLAKTFARAHGRYAQYSNSLLQRSGHFWQNRFYSCALDDAHLWAALRYVELNPVRSGLRAAPEDWTWSSASVHAGQQTAPQWLDLAPWRSRFTHREWMDYLAAETFGEAEDALRLNTYSGRPLGTDTFIERMEAQLGRRLRPRKGGRPRAADSAAATAAGSGQGILFPKG
jgi:putative transposase